MTKLAATIVTAALIAAAPAAAEDSGDWLGCTTPISARTTAKSVLHQWPNEAHRAKIEGAEGATTPGVILFGKAAADGLSITWWDKEQTAVSGLTSRAPRWSVAGIKVGSSLAAVEAANGKAFTLSGFEWDYAGAVTNWNGGKLEKAAGASCTVMIRFGSKKPAPEALSGDRSLSSKDKKLRAFAPVVTEISLGWPLPKGVKAADDAGGQE